MAVDIKGSKKDGWIQSGQVLYYTPAAAATALPHVGAIGKKLQHQPGGGVQHKTVQEFSKVLKPGDILLTGHANKLTPLRFFINLGTGTPRGYHAEIVDKILPGGRIQTLNFDNDTGYHRNVIDLNAVNRPHETRFKPDIRPRNMTAFRTKNENARTRGLTNIRNRVDAFEKIRKELISRGVPKELAQKQTAKAFTPAIGGKLALRELFVPYFAKNEAKAESYVRAAESATDNLLKNIEGTSTQIIDHLKKGKDTAKIIPSCLKGVCSSAVGTAGFGLSGPSAKLTSPADILRSKNIKTVGSYVEKGKTTVNVAINPALRYAPHLVRGAAGLGLGAATLMATKALVKKHKELKIPKAKKQKNVIPLPVFEKKKVAEKKSKRKDYLAPAAIGGGVGAGVGAQNYLSNLAMYKSIKGRSEEAIKLQAETAKKIYTELEKKYMGNDLGADSSKAFQKRRNLLRFWHGHGNKPIKDAPKLHKQVFEATSIAAKGLLKGQGDRAISKLIERGGNLDFLKIPITPHGKPDFTAKPRQVQNRLLPAFRAGVPHGKLLAGAALAGLMVGIPTTVGAAYMLHKTHQNKRVAGTKTFKKIDKTVEKIIL